LRLELDSLGFHPAFRQLSRPSGFKKAKRNQKII